MHRPTGCLTVDGPTVDGISEADVLQKLTGVTLLSGKGVFSGRNAPTQLTGSVCCSQIGQVMLALPHAVNLCGLRAATPLIAVYSLCSMFTIHLLTTLYCDLRRRKVSMHRNAPG